MKEETNKEMDLLLRRLGRRPDTSMSDANGDVDHLDADELNAYAENVLPAAARARYTEHLAECARCRELIVQLSSSAGVVPVVETPRTPAPSALRKFLASFFSPMVLRYAVPALGLIVVAAIGFFVLKQKQAKEASVAQNVEAKYATPTSTPQKDPPAITFSYDAPEKAPGKTAENSGSPSNQPAAAAPAPPPTVRGQVADAPQDSLAKKEEQQPVTTEAPKPAPTFATDEDKRQAEKAGKKAPQVQVAAEPQTEKTVDAVVKDDDRKAAETAKTRADTATANKSRVYGVAQGVAGTGSRREEASETRTVAGRQFRKQGNVWIDTAYASSQRITGLSRGSEQYRALIADEPVIKTIADQLDGEIIVVWKGHTYRIR